MATYNAKKLTIVKGGDTYIIDPMQGNDAAFYEYDITIPVNGWSVSAPYTYTWSNAHVTSNSIVLVEYKTGVRDGLVGDLTRSKATGSVTFTTSELPVGDIPLHITIICTNVDGIFPVYASDVETDAIVGETSVQGALEDLDGRASENTENIGEILSALEGIGLTVYEGQLYIQPVTT